MVSAAGIHLDGMGKPTEIQISQCWVFNHARGIYMTVWDAAQATLDHRLAKRANKLMVSWNVPASADQSEVLVQLPGVCVWQDSEPPAGSAAATIDVVCAGQRRGREGIAVRPRPERPWRARALHGSYGASFPCCHLRAWFGLHSARV